MYFLHRPSLSALVLICCVSTTANAQYLYQFESKSGERLLTNQVDQGKRPVGAGNQHFTRQVKVTWYPDTNVHRYGNWGDNEAAVRPSMSKNRNAFDDLIRQAANKYQLDFGLIKAIIHTESGFNPNAKSGPGAQGLMQLMPATAARYNVANVWDPAQNIEAGSRHFRHLLNRYDDLTLALAAYNAGEGNVRKYNGVPPFAETRDYIQRVTGRYQRLYGGGSTRLGAVTP